MAKQVIISAVEEVFGEYILNISKENLKIAAIRGKIKLENVQLDGDLIGSHVLGAVGLSGFGVLSCSAKSIRVSVPWKNLEKEPTRFEIRGMHLICVPLTPSTANNMYGAGTKVDPRCSLRTRAKRLVLARYERNFWNGQIPDEGPLMKRISRAVKDVERDLKKKKVRRRDKKKNNEEEMDSVIDNLVSELTDKDSSDSIPPSFSPDDLPDLPRDWKVKLREKALRNMEASITETHIRCEVPATPGEASGDVPPLALGFTLERFVVRTADENWEVGSHDKRDGLVETAMSSGHEHLGPNKYVVKNNKIGYFENLSLYWDDRPPILLAETDVLQGNCRKLTPDKLLSRLSTAMEALTTQQEPGRAIRKSLSTTTSPEDDILDIPHRYVCKGLRAEVRSRCSDRTQPGPISCSADVMPCDFTFDLQPHEYLQYQRLKAAMRSQQRFDTMLRLRPTTSPKEDPRAWWKYTIACVTARPNSRPWEDVKRIISSRSRYIELVSKKNAKTAVGIVGNGYHFGLTDEESAELLILEDLLPIEALLAFHLLALRQVHNAHVGLEMQSVKTASPAKSKPKSRFRLLRSSGSRKTAALVDGQRIPVAPKPRSPSPNDDLPSDRPRSISLLDAMTMRLGRKTWLVDWRLHDAIVNVLLRRRQDDDPAALMVLRASGSARSFGKGQRDFFFDITQCELHHADQKVLFVSQIDSQTENDPIDEDTELVFGGLDDEVTGLAFRDKQKEKGPDLATPSSFLELPPEGTVCRLAAGKNQDAFKMSVSAHPLTLVWTASLFDSISGFLANSTSTPGGDITEHIKNAATPLARKAQLALLSPASSALYVNVAAPKVWIPIVSSDTESALFLDAGTIKLSTLKNEGQVDTDWGIEANDIQVNFIRDYNSARLYSDHRFVDTTYRAETYVIRPFSIEAHSKIVEKSSAPGRGKDVCFAGPVRNVLAVVSPICLNLVDAEALARSLGKWYARVIRRLRARDGSTNPKHEIFNMSMNGVSSRREEEQKLETIVRSDIPSTLSLRLEKIEVAIEGHSKKHPNVSFDDKSLASYESFLEYSPPTRTYLVEIFRIFVQRSCLEQMETTKLSVFDASIVRLRDSSSYSPFKARREMVESENCILVCTKSPDKRPVSFVDGDEGNDRNVLRLSFLRDSSAHLDEVEIDIQSVMFRVTPTTLKDCTKAFRRIVEVVQVTTTEMERKVHEAGRKARRKDRFAPRDGISRPDSPSLEQPLSPTISEEGTTVFTVIEPKSPKAPSDSSILFKITLNDTTILAGRPTSAIQKIGTSSDRRLQYAVIQILSNALIMFQSIENPDGTGHKTLHVSVDNVSSLVNTEFERLTPAQAPPMISPFGAEFRIVYSTENLGCVVSQDISLDCEAVKAHLTPNDLSIMINISRRMIDRLKAFGSEGSNVAADHAKPNSHGSMASFVRYRKKGTGIATSVRAEIHTFSFVLLRAFKSHSGAPEFLDFNVKDIKLRLGGCMSALSGDGTALVSVNSFNSEVEDWEYAVEPFSVHLSIEQMPNELLVDAATSDSIQVNLTGVMLNTLAEMKFDILRDRVSADTGDDRDILNPSALSTVGLRRATEAKTINVKNTTGLDLHVIHDSSSFEPDSGLVLDGEEVILSNLSSFEDREYQEHSLSLRLASSTKGAVGEREPVFDLPVMTSLKRHASLHLLRPVAVGLRMAQPKRDIRLDRSRSPEAIPSEDAELSMAYYNAEPVAEWCMHNQRLRSTISDAFSLSKGRDLLSSEVWSPEDDLWFDNKESSSPGSLRGKNTGRSLVPRGAARINWLKPYLKNDSPEWTDMTCTLRMARDRVMLPDSSWIWVNDWTVDLSGALGEETDADGWEYQSDFETFTRTRRYYQRGDSCRRRRWTRTRMMKPPSLNDPQRQLKFVWETSKDSTGNCSIVVRSNVRIKNQTSSPFSVFLSSPSWGEDQYAGVASAGCDMDVPVLLSSAVYMRIAKPQGLEPPTRIEQCPCTDRIMIIPTSPSSENYTRASMELEDVSRTSLHFFVAITSTDGIVDICVQPVFRMLNLLPCRLECQVGQLTPPAEVLGSPRRPHSRRAESKTISQTEMITISSGKEGSSSALNPWLKPHISLRVPGYQWSPWHRILNRKSNSDTWLPPASEEDMHFSHGDSDFAEETTTIVRFERIGKCGDPLVLLLSIECGHCPTLRVYAQYWIVDKTGFGCRFTEGFKDIMASDPDRESSRRSHLPSSEKKDTDLRKDMTIPGHQWSIGMHGMTMYFSKREKLTLAIENSREGKNSKRSEKIKSKWVTPLDISNVMPKTVFSVEELGGRRRFELAFNVTVCSGVFSRTKMITLFPRYQIVNLLHRELVVAQEGCLDRPTSIPSQSTVSFHWEQGSLPPKILLGVPTIEERARGDYERCWSNGRMQIDRVGITSMRLPASNNLATVPMVIQAEVRLALKDQPSAVVIVIWSATEKSNPLYVLRNRTKYTILCRQPVNHDGQNGAGTDNTALSLPSCSPGVPMATNFECGASLGPIIREFLGLDSIEEFVWILKRNEEACFGFDDPEKPHVLEWTCVRNDSTHFDNRSARAFLEVDAMGSSSVVKLTGGRYIWCMIKAEHSTKVIEFVEDYARPPSNLKQSRGGEDIISSFSGLGAEYNDMLALSGGLPSQSRAKSGDEEEEVSFGFRLDIPSLLISVIDNADPQVHGREILLGQAERMYCAFSQSREGYHEFEVRVMAFQVDNHVRRSIHPILVFCPQVDSSEPLLHMSAVRRLLNHGNTFVFRYAAVRLLEVEIYLDRRTAETIARFIEPLTSQNEFDKYDQVDWVSKLAERMELDFSRPDNRAPKEIEKMIHLANSGRIYFEQLHLHPVRIGLTFTQEWMDWNAGAEEVMLFQFIRGMASIANAPLVFTSFVVGHVFEAPQALVRVITTHYSSQLTKQIFGILGSLAILGAPADFISNVGTGVRDFFYEPIQGAVHGPRQFIEGLEAGTQSLARGVFVGVVRGAANVTEAVNANLAGLTADDDFMDERRAHQRMMTDSLSRGSASRTFGDSLYLAGASMARSIKSGAFGIVEQPSMYASKHGPVGFVKGVGKALVGAVVKPVVGIGDAAVLVMNHMSDATSKKKTVPKIPIRIRRALPSRSTEKLNCVRLEPFDERAAKAQKIVTGGESVDDVYIGHINTPNHLIIASEQCLWAIDRRSREPWCVNWEEISHFGMLDGGIRIVVFSQMGLKNFVFNTDSQPQSLELKRLLLMQSRKMANSANLSNSDSLRSIPGIKSRQIPHVFGSFNHSRPILSVKDEVELVEECYGRVHVMGSEEPKFFKKLDEEAWNLVAYWGQVFSGLSSRRCVVASIINGTGGPIQIKSTKLVEGGSPCYCIPTKELDTEQGVLHSGGVVILFAWGVGPNLLQAGNVFMHIETNGFLCELADTKGRETFAKARPGYQVGFLEKSYDDSGWWAKYWLLVRSEK